MGNTNFADASNRIKQGEFPANNEDYIMIVGLSIFLVILSFFVEGLMVYVLIAICAGIAALVLFKGSINVKNNGNKDNIYNNNENGEVEMGNATQSLSKLNQLVPVKGDPTVKVLKTLANVIEGHRKSRGSSLKSGKNYYSEPYQYPSNVEYPPEQVTKSQLSILCRTTENTPPGPSIVIDSPSIQDSSRNKAKSIDDGHSYPLPSMNSDQQLELLSQTIMELCKIHEDKPRDKRSINSNSSHNSKLIRNQTTNGYNNKQIPIENVPQDRIHTSNKSNINTMERSLQTNVIPTTRSIQDTIINNIPEEITDNIKKSSDIETDDIMGCLFPLKVAISKELITDNSLR